MPKKATNSSPLEIEEQEAVVAYLEVLVSLGKVSTFSAVPNNTYTKSWSQKRKQKREGVRSGVPDLIIVTPLDVIFLEMKRVKGGILSPEQKEWGKALVNTGKVQYAVCRGFYEAKVFIDSVVLKE